jgi:phosphoribosylglycinamide formyltransferase 1
VSVKGLRIGVLGSGRGSNFEAIAQAVGAGKLPGVVIAVVISDDAEAPILDLARRRGVKAVHIAPGRYKTWLEPEVESKYAVALKEHGVELVVLAGFMRVVKQPLLGAFPNGILNIHPSLLPKFPGLEAWSQALKARVKVTGCTVHVVNGQIDAGPIILQESVPVLADDTPETLHARIQEKEHVLYPRVIAGIVEGTIRLGNIF